MEISVKTSVQDSYLAEARDMRTPIIIYMMNGFQMRGIVSDFDDFTIVVESDGKRQLLYKHAISTVAPQIEKTSVRKPGSTYGEW